MQQLHIQSPHAKFLSLWAVACDCELFTACFDMLVLLSGSSVKGPLGQEQMSQNQRQSIRRRHIVSSIPSDQKTEKLTLYLLTLAENQDGKNSLKIEFLFRMFL